MLPHAMSWRKSKEEKPKLDTRSTPYLSNECKRKRRKMLTRPTKLETKDVLLPSGLKVVIRRPTLFEISDWVKEVKERTKESEEFDPDLVEAVKRLLG
jgi:hypothetical protein